MKAASVFAVIFAFLGLWAYFDFDAFLDLIFTSLPSAMIYGC